MKCISLWQPWATLIAIGAKRIETRSWSTNYRGPIAIHAAKKWSRDIEDVCFQPFFLRALRQNEGDAEAAMIRRIRSVQGCIVATATLYECMGVERLERAHANQTPDLDEKIRATLRFAGHSEERIDDALRLMLTDQERAFGDYSPGRFGWLLADVVPLPKPIPFRGAQGLFKVPDEILRGAV